MSGSEQNVCFDEAALVAMIVAYDQPCRSLQSSGMKAIVPEMIGIRIIEAAKPGDRDPDIRPQQALNTLDVEKT